MKRIHVLLTVWVTALIVAPGSTRAAEITVLSDSPLAPALARIAEAFRRDSGHEVKFVFGLSPVIHKRVIDGETGDVVIIQPNFINDLVSAGKDRKSTRLNSSHANISYAVFCLKKKKTQH